MANIIEDFYNGNIEPQEVNSDLLCDEFMKGALESGNEAQKIRVTEKNA